MPIVEYKLILTNDGMQKPPYILKGGKASSPIDHTLVGYVLPNNLRRYWVPDELKELSRDDFINRSLEIHKVAPYVTRIEQDPEAPQEDEEEIVLTEQQVKESAGIEYDEFKKRMLERYEGE